MKTRKEGSSLWQIDDTRVEVLIGMLLRIGVFVSAFVVFIGAILFFYEHAASPLTFSVFAGEPHALRNVFSIVSSAWHLNGVAVIQFGIILLIATPIARVLFSLIAFYIEKDWMYVLLTFIVLSILIYSISGGY